MDDASDGGGGSSWCQWASSGISGIGSHHECGANILRDIARNQMPRLPWTQGCPPCAAPMTEPTDGIRKRARQGIGGM